MRHFKEKNKENKKNDFLGNVQVSRNLNFTQFQSMTNESLKFC